ncbi:baseplate assembly protein [Qipengyuania citrea]|uniref:baseplate assembly protein n=1 Tax=Qipengyuania citrea TaxID=225971 RepID=UPI0020A1AB5D|nr:baseplate J/gp47 family protein [Qipengyuania citrea]MCP2016837.1 phage-related baseplate assembly protein [Qipengyuania citrea]
MSASSSIATSTAVELSRLPPPDVVEALEFETIFAARLAEFQANYPDHDALVESDPVFKLLEVGAYQELVLRQRINEAARACMVAYSLGSDLDNLAAVFGVTRLVVTPADEQTATPAVMEADEALRRRVLLAADAYSVAGPTAAYIFHALTASGEVFDASAISPAPGEVLVTVLSTQGTGTASPELLATVEAAVAGDTVRPLTDQVTVQGADIVDFAIDAQLTLYPGPDRALVEAAARASLAKELADRRRLGRDVTRSALYRALHVGGVHNVVINSPAADIVLDDTQAWNVTDTQLLVGGVMQ